MLKYKFVDRLLSINCFELETGLTSDEWLNELPDNVFVRVRNNRRHIMTYTPNRGLIKYESNCDLTYDEIQEWLDMKVVKALGWSRTDSIDGLIYAEIELGD